VIDHQRLSGAGYVFSASGPPFSSVAGTKALSLVMAEAKTLLPKLRTNVDYIQKKLRALDGIVVKSSPESPLIYLSLTSAHEDHKKAVKSIASMMMLNAVAIRAPTYIPAERDPPPPSLCIEVNLCHTTADLDKCVAQLKVALERCL